MVGIPKKHYKNEWLLDGNTTKERWEKMQFEKKKG
jgi:hypothetical protein